MGSPRRIWMVTIPGIYLALDNHLCDYCLPPVYAEFRVQHVCVNLGINVMHLTIRNI